MPPDLSTTYLHLRLSNPLVPSASPLTRSLDNIRRLEDAGAAAIVLHSLFEEQITFESTEQLLLKLRERKLERELAQAEGESLIKLQRTLAKLREEIRAFA